MEDKTDWLGLFYLMALLFDQGEKSNMNKNIPQKCPCCGEVIISLIVLRHNTSSKPIGKDVKARFCPFCGVPMGEE